MKNVNKISIVGGPGTGKSTLAKNLGKKLNLPVYHLDQINFLENWEERDKEERDNIILEKVKENKWIIDGTYKKTLEERIKNADLVIFLNYSKLARLKGILSRYKNNKNKERFEIPGCEEKMELSFVKFTLSWEKTNKNFVKEILEKYNNKEILIFKNRKKLNKWYEKEFGEKIEIYEN